MLDDALNYYAKLNKTKHLPRWSIIRRELKRFFPTGLNLDIRCVAYPMHSSWVPSKKIPRYFFVLDGEIIWDFPRVLTPPRGGFWVYDEVFRIYPLSIKEHINSPIEASIAGMLEEVTGFREMLVAADRRLGKRRAKKILISFRCEAAKKVILARWPEFQTALTSADSIMEGH